MAGEVRTHPTPPLRLSASSVPQLIGLSPLRGTYDVLAMLRRQRDGTALESKPRMIPYEDYWMLVGIIREHASLSRKDHIDLIRDFIDDKSHPDSWYKKLYETIWKTVGTTIHSDMLDPQPTAFEANITPDIILVGKPDAIDPVSKTVTELKTKKVAIIYEHERVQLMCYMKLLKYDKGILIVKTPSETIQEELSWDDAYWDKIVRSIVTILEWL